MQSIEIKLEYDYDLEYEIIDLEKKIEIKIARQWTFFINLEL